MENVGNVPYSVVRQVIQNKKHKRRTLPLRIMLDLSIKHYLT